MRTLRALLPLLVAVLVLVAGASARAGGSWLEPDRLAYALGDTATLSGRFDMSGSLQGTPADRPYVAYLLADDQWIRPSRVPPGAIRLGEIRIVRSESSYPTRAVVTFRVPDVPMGWYHVGYCNDPCTVDGIGDLIGSEGFVIAPTRFEGLAFIRRARLVDKLDQARSSLSSTRVDRDELERAVDEQTEGLLGAGAEIASLERELAGRTFAPMPEDEVSVTWWIALVAAVAGFALGIVAGRRRAEPIVVPDTVPSDLEMDPVRLPL